MPRQAARSVSWIASSASAAEPTRAFGRAFDLVDLDVRKPGRLGRTASNDSAIELSAERQRVVARGADVDPLGAPAQQLRVERAGAEQIAGVQLEMDDAIGLAGSHLSNKRYEPISRNSVVTAGSS